MISADADFRCVFETKGEAGDESAAFAGVASTSDIDLDGDIIEPGAFLPIATKANGSPDVLLLRDHDRTQVIGGWTRIAQQGRELVVEGQLCLAVEKARETYALMKGGYLSGLSVGFMTDKGGIKWDGARRRICKGALREISVVAMPANNSARVSAVKGWLKEFGLSAAEAELMQREGLASVFHAREVRRELSRLLAQMREGR